MVSKVYGHIGCPSCPSSDAFFVYKDGHGHCFSCGYHDPGTKTIKSLKKKLSQDEVASFEIKTADYTYNIPKIALNWLKKYDISDLEIARHKLMWNEKTTSLVFPIYNKDGKLVVTNERYFGEKVNHPKYLTKGNKTSYCYVVSNPVVQSDMVVAVEDFVSAIKVGRQFHCVPLLGASIPVGWLISLSERFSTLGVWLDPNKGPESVVEASRASQYIKHCRSIHTEQDPKDYDDAFIKHRVIWVDR